jgi:hypothetical protein
MEGQQPIKFYHPYADAALPINPARTLIVWTLLAMNVLTNFSTSSPPRFAFRMA